MATKVKVDAEIQVLCYPKYNIDKLTSEAFSVRDYFGDLIEALGGDSGTGYSNDLLPQFAGISWTNQDAFTRLDKNIVFSRFNPDGTVSWGTTAQKATEGLAGLSIKRKLQPLNARVGSSRFDPKGLDAYPTMPWNMINSEGWEVVAPPSTKGTRIYHRQQSANQTVQARTHYPLPYNQGFYTTINLLGKAKDQENEAALRIMFSDGYYSILLHENEKPMFQVANKAGSWNNLKTFDALAVVNVEATYTIEVFILGGRFIFGFNGQYFYYTDTEVNDNTETKVAFLPSGKVAAQSYGLPFNLELGLIHYGVLDFKKHTGLPSIAIFSRSKNQTNKCTGTLTIDGLVGGSKDNGSTAKVAISRNSAGAGYTCTMKSSPFKKPKGSNFKGFMGCTDTPFVMSVIGFYYPEFTADSRLPIDIRVACQDATLTGPQPPNSTGSTLDINVDRKSLTNIPLPSDKDTNPVTTSWTDYVKPFNPIEFKSRDIFDDGTYGEWDTLFKGWQFYPTKSSNEVSSQVLSLKCIDEVGRMTLPHAIINRKVPALDFKFNLDKVKVYGWDGIYEIIAIFRGITVANQLNGGTLGRFFPPKSHYALHDPTDNLASYFPAVQRKPPNAGFIFVPPYKQDPITWMKSISEYDYATLMYDRHPIISPHTPIWVYGRWNFIVGGQTAEELTDQLYAVNTNQNQLIEEIESRFLADKMYNNIEVWGPAASGPMGAFIPTVVSEEARLSATDPNSQEESWPRTYILQEDFLLNRGVEAAKKIAAEAAQSAINEFANRDLNFVKAQIYYNTGMMWGKLVKFKTSGVLSDTNLGLDGKSYYVVRCEHKWNFTRQDAARWAYTTVYCRMASASEVA